MPIRKLCCCLVVSLLTSLVPARGASPDPYAAETPAQRDARMKWWREARFGLFIHWGVYAVPAGYHAGKPVAIAGEWIMLGGRIPVADYKRYARDFNPVRYDPDAWVRLAKEAGMKYIVITAKHHDGFALYDTKASDWDVVDATPYGRDLLKPLAEACRKHGMKLGFYYSHAQDWTHPGGAIGATKGSPWDPAQKGDRDAYLQNIAYPQVREILSNYGDLAVLWWDTPREMTPERAERFLPLLKLQPGIIHNDRLGGGYKGDTNTPEQHVPPTGFPGRDWETCMTMNDTWGYKRDDQNWKSAPTLIRNLVDIASKGGNYLLNVGPNELGEIPAASVERLQAIGAWMKVNGEAIYATSASPFYRLPWGRCTRKSEGAKTTLYLHVFDWPANGRLVVPGLLSPVTSARLLAAGTTLRTAVEKEDVVIAVPAQAPDPVASVVVLEVSGDVRVKEWLPEPDAAGALRLLPGDAELHEEGIGHQLKIEERQGVPHIGHWTDHRSTVAWRFRIIQPGTYVLRASIAAEKPTHATVEVAGQKLAWRLRKTKSYDAFRVVEVGRLTIATAGEHRLLLRPAASGWTPANLRFVELRRETAPAIEK